LPAKVAQQVLINLDKNWQSFFAAKEEFKEHPEKFHGKPSLPGYKEKQKGRNLLVYTTQAISKESLRDGIIKHSQLSIEVKTKQKKINQVRIVPRKTHYVFEVVYEQKEVLAKVNQDYIAGKEVYVGKRIKRGLFQSQSGKLINADVNGAYNIIRKVAPNAFSNGVEGVVVHPLRVSLKNEPVE